MIVFFSSLLSARHPRMRGSNAIVLGLVLLLALAASGCSSRRLANPAPVEDRMAVRAEVKTLPGAENAGKPGYYTVRPGDTLYRIALDSGQSWSDLQTWNALSNPNVLEVGQVLRVSPPAGAATAPVVAPAPAVSTSAITSTNATPRPLTPGPAPASNTTPAATTSTGASGTATAAPVPQPANTDEVGFIWPAQGAVIANFDDPKNKGISIAGRMGEPVLAAADGRVVYAGAGLRGYGNLIILKHNNTYLTAYAHNQALLVREDQAVKQGQKIAEMGSSDTDRVKLHFEVRRLGKPVNPITHLPKR